MKGTTIQINIFFGVQIVNKMLVHAVYEMLTFVLGHLTIIALLTMFNMYSFLHISKFLGHRK